MSTKGRSQEFSHALQKIESGIDQGNDIWKFHVLVVINSIMSEAGGVLRTVRGEVYLKLRPYNVSLRSWHQDAGLMEMEIQEQGFVSISDLYLFSPVSDTAIGHAQLSL